MKLPNLKRLATFEAVARLGGVRRAAEELGIDHSLVSRHLIALQHEIGAVLIVTSRRGVVLTESGAQYYQTIRDAFDAVSTATGRLQTLHGSRGLIISSIPGFALNWLTPRLNNFQELCPDVEITLKPSQHSADLEAGEADAVIHYGELRGANIRVEALAKPRVFPVMSPAQRAKLPRVVSPTDLIGLPLIHEESDDQWHNWFRAAGVDPVPTLRGPKLWHANMAMEAAKRGQGVALANELIAAEDLTARNLVEVTASDVRLAPYVFAARSDQWLRPAVAKFRRWLQQTLGGARG